LRHRGQSEVGDHPGSDDQAVGRAAELEVAEFVALGHVRAGLHCAGDISGPDRSALLSAFSAWDPGRWVAPPQWRLTKSLPLPGIELDRAAGQRSRRIVELIVVADRHVRNDLAELKGIGPKYAQMLKEIGVDSIKELSHRNPSHLKQMIEERHGPVVGMSEDECRDWIEQAKAHQA
jgi:hypothetical protein